MTTRPITITWEVLTGICSEGARLTWADRPDEYAVCVTGVSPETTIDQVIVNPDRTITIICNDPHYDGTTEASPMWRMVRETPE